MVCPQLVHINAFLSLMWSHCPHLHFHSSRVASLGAPITVMIVLSIGSGFDALACGPVDLAGGGTTANGELATKVFFLPASQGADDAFVPGWSGMASFL